MNNWYYGVVEDRNDPLQIGRVRVRVHGVHTDNKQFIASPDLPWSQVLMPTSSASLSGFGHSHGLVEGTSVYGMFRDSDMQDFIVFGSIMGYSQKGYKQTSTEELLDRSIDAGFNDPRRATASEYDGSLDGLNPPTGKRPNSLSLALDTSPQLPESIELKYDGTENTITEPTEKTTPYYPLSDYYDESDLNRFARAGGVYDIRDNLPEGFKLELEELYQPTVWNEETGRKSLYPFNKVHHTESGHMIEMDDSVGAERLAVQHRSGTFVEIHRDGSEVHQIVNDHVKVTAKDDKVYIGGNADVVVESGNVNIEIRQGNVDLKVLKGNVTELVAEGNVDSTVSKGNVTSNITEGNFTGQIGGTTDVTSEGKITITGNNTTEVISDTTITGTLHVTGKQTNDSTIHAKGDISTSAGSGPTLATHTHKTVVSGGSSSGTYTSKKP